MHFSHLEIPLLRLTHRLVVLAALALAGCGGSSSAPGPGGSGNGGGGSGSLSIGEYIDIEDALDDHTIVDMRITNNGVYMLNILGIDDEGSRVHRLALGGPSPEWIKYDFDDHLFGYMPTSMENEGEDEFSIFYYTIDRNGYAGINTGTPALMESDSPTLSGKNPDFMLVDNGSLALTWAVFFDNNYLTTIKYRTGANTAGDTYDTALTANPLPSRINVVEADDDESFFWAGGKSHVYRFDINETYDVYDLANVASFGPAEYVSKIRVVDDVVWVGTGRNIFRIDENGAISLFATLTGAASTVFGMGDFAVDGGYVYTTDGERISVTHGTRSDIFPPLPAGATQEEMTEYYMMLGDFQAGPLEVSTDFLSPYIYSLTGGSRILRVKKHYEP